MDQHFSIDIAKYTKSNNILVGFNLYKPLEFGGSSHKKVIGTIISHAEPQTSNEQTFIRSFNVVLNWNKESYKRAQTEEQKQLFVSVIETENIINYELATVKTAIPKWSRPALAKVMR